MKPSISHQSDLALQQLICPSATVSTRTVLRSCPSSSFRYTHTYRRDRWKAQIDQEQEEALKTLKATQRAESRRPYKDEYSKVCRQIEAKYRQLDFQTDAKVWLWEQSERLLSLYRTKGLTPTPDEATKRQALFKFVQNVQLDSFPEIRGDTPQTFNPNGYFELTQPELVAQYGLPFYSTVTEPIRENHRHPVEAAPVERIIGINTDFWGAWLGGDKRLGHDCVFSMVESRFYFFDQVAACYVPTSDEKMRLWACQSLQNRAWGQSESTAKMILEQFRTKRVLDEIITKAKSILAADAGFFAGPGVRLRRDGTQKPHEVQVLVDSFVKEHVEQADGGIMTLGDCLLQLGKTSTVSVNKKELTLKVNDAIRSTFNRGLRNDLRLADNRTVAGWKGLRLRGAETLQGENSSIRRSAPSETEIHEQPMEIALVS